MTEQSVEIRFKGNRRVWHVWAADASRLRLNEGVIVQAERGLDFGWVNRNEAVESSCDGCTSCETGLPAAEGEATPVVTTTSEAPAKPAIIRRAAPKEISKHEEQRRSEDDVRRHVMARVAHFKLAMRITDAEWQWDSTRLTIYFTSERRVDFRDLVRELATHFRARIELRQIGVRDEAARLGGVGRCGREYCCSTWLTEPGPVNLALAKDQRLSLNPSQISGGCGRLLCCLKYEHEFYVTSRKRFPKEGKTLVTQQGIEKVIAVDIFRERVYLRGAELPGRVIPLLQLRDEIELAAAGVSAPPLSSAPPVVAQGAPASPTPPAGPTAPVASEAAAAQAPKRQNRRPHRGNRKGPPPGSST